MCRVITIQRTESVHSCQFLIYLPKVFQTICLLLFSLSVHPIRVTIYDGTIFEHDLHYEVRKIRIEILNWMRWLDFDFPTRVHGYSPKWPVKRKTKRIGKIINIDIDSNEREKEWQTTTFDDEWQRQWIMFHENRTFVRNEIFTSVKHVSVLGTDDQSNPIIVFLRYLNYALWLIIDDERVRLIVELTH